MVYEMKLNEEPLNMIKEGNKKIELRLFDDKRRALQIGDKIIFTNINNENDKLAVTITSLYRSVSFKELFQDISLEKCGFYGMTIEDAVNRMRKFYSEEKEKQLGVLGIKVQVDNLEDVILLQREIEENTFDRLFPDGFK